MLSKQHPPSGIGAGSRAALLIAVAALFACGLAGIAADENPTPPNAASWLRIRRRRHSSQPASPRGLTTADEGVARIDEAPPARVVGFWHIGPANKGLGPKNRGSLILKQLEELRKLPIFGKVEIRFLNDPDAVDAALLAALTSEPNFVPIPIPARFARFRQAGEKLYEYPTLSAFWSHCHANAGDIVFYFHTKTRPGKRNWYQDNMFHDPGLVIRLLRNNNRIYTPTRCESIPFCHAPGNFFWARCDHVVRLNDPFDESFLSEPGEYFDNPPRGRYMAEYWLVSDFLGPRKVRESVLHPGRRWNRTWSKGTCMHPEHGDLCQGIAVAQNITGVSWNDWWERKARPEMVPFDP